MIWMSRPRTWLLVVWSILFLLSFSSVLYASADQEETEPFVEESILWAGMDDPDAMLLKEIEWAQKSMELYHEKNGVYPSRTSDDDSSKEEHHHDVTNIYSMDWVEESLESLRQQEVDYNTRDSRRKNRGARFLRGAG
ncbi:unnamed protein product [Cylindrotheca closterium]|uniref:SCP domain-containing protein n=1 Tax=Cylindrotheca closterium TaxID=2856 RepID=A0AAD2GA97_9STRA|nr:unnamed protein product [Cylindrotheca closterium]